MEQQVRRIHGGPVRHRVLKIVRIISEANNATRGKDVERRRYRTGRRHVVRGGGRQLAHQRVGEQAGDVGGHIEEASGEATFSLKG